MAAPEPEDEGPWLNARWALIVAVVLVVVVRELVPFGRQILYPLTLFATWVHEMGHGLTGLAVGGTFDQLEIFGNAAGLARGSVDPGWPRALRAAGGLVGPPAVGAAMLAFSRGPRRATIALAVLAAVMTLSVPIWVRSLVGWIVIPALATAFALLAYKGADSVKHLAAQGLGVVLGLDTITRIDYLFTAEVHVGGQLRPSDVSHISEAIGGPFWLWGLLLAALSLALVALGVRAAWMEEVKLPKLPWPRRPKDVPSSDGGRPNL